MPDKKVVKKVEDDELSKEDLDLKKSLDTLLEEEDENVEEPEYEEEESSGDDDDTVNKPNEDTLEDKARAFGHKSREEFEGNPEEWVDAAEFLRRRPLFDSLHKANRRTKQLEKEIAALVKFQKKQQDLHKAQQANLVKELKEAKKAAAKEGDAARMLEIDDQLEEVQSAVAKQTPTQDDDSQDDPAFAKWVENNSWYEEDDEMAAVAEGIGARLQKKGTMDNEELLDAVTGRIKELYPNKFKNKRRSNPSKVSPGGTKHTPKKGLIGYADLDAEAKAMFRRFVKSKNNPDGIMSAEEYLSQYAAVSGANS